MYYTVTILLGRLTENGSFSYQIIRKKFKGICKKWYGVLLLYQNNGNISLTVIRLSGALCVSQYSKNFEFIRILYKSQSNYGIWNSTDMSKRFQGP